ncbi:MAG: hypothetical protein KDD48_04340 [Bdellovibrionales bacterium]|nr:hypothetical protein [Bdellovibrionales bacterium]
MNLKLLVGLLFLVLHTQAHAFGGWAGVPHLIKLVAESTKRAQQLRQMIQQNREYQQYLRNLNHGVDQVNGVLSTLPIEDERVLKEVTSMRDALKTIERLYGKTPPSAEAQIQTLHDKSIAESLKMNVNISQYAKHQEQNALKFSSMANSMSPKGAARMSAQTNAQILHTLNQLLKVNGQMLKLQSEKLAIDNKQGKDSVSHFNAIGEDLKTSGDLFNHNFTLPEF